MIDIYDISVFRSITLLSSFIILIIFFIFLRKRKFSVGEYLFWSSISLAIFILSLKPQIINYIFYYINLSSNERYDRLILVNYIFSFLLIFLLFYYRGKINSSRESFIKNIQNQSVKKFLSNTRISLSNDLIILIPAYNEEDNISSTLNKIPEQICGLKPFVLVISDGSDDETACIVEKMGFNVVEHSVNLGQCAAYRTGYMISKSLDFKYLIHLDADGQYNPTQIERLLMPLISDNFDFISGSRILGYYENKYSYNQIIRTIGLAFFNLILSIILKRKITDSASGFRSIKVELLKKLVLKQEQFHSTELLLEAVSKGSKFKEVPVSFLKRSSGKSKKPHFIKYGFGFSIAILKTWLRIK